MELLQKLFKQTEKKILMYFKYQKSHRHKLSSSLIIYKQNFNTIDYKCNDENVWCTPKYFV